jgi:hypothetical protein
VNETVYVSDLKPSVIITDKKGNKIARWESRMGTAYGPTREAISISPTFPAMPFTNIADAPRRWRDYEVPAS